MKIYSSLMLFELCGRAKLALRVQLLIEIDELSKYHYGISLSIDKL